MPVRKTGKLPGRCVSAKYALEYGTVSVYVKACSEQKSGWNVLGHVRNASRRDCTWSDRRCGRRLDSDRCAIMDQSLNRLLTEAPLLGGSAKAAGELVSQQGGIVLEYLFIVELSVLKGSDKLDAPIYSIIQSYE